MMRIAQLTARRKADVSQQQLPHLYKGAERFPRQDTRPSLEQHNVRGQGARRGGNR